MNKYYTPEIEEFHVGFEYEVYEDFDYYPEKSWHTQVYGKDGSDMERIGYVSGFDMSIFRVKYLNHEDITSLGWTQTSYDQFEKDMYHLEIGEEGELHIHSFIRERAYVLFNGKVKNK